MNRKTLLELFGGLLLRRRYALLLALAPAAPFLALSGMPWARRLLWGKSDDPKAGLQAEPSPYVYTLY